MFHAWGALVGRRAASALSLVLVVAVAFADPLLAQEFTSDAATSLLLHCNNALAGAAGETPTQATGTSYAAGIFGQGVNLPTGSRLAYDAAGNLAAAQGTLEFWLRPNWNGNDEQNHLVLTWGTWGGILAGKDAGNFWRIIVNRWGPGGTSERGAGFSVDSEWAAGAWHHCAFTWSSTQVQVYVDGVLRAQEPVGFALPSIGNTTFQVGGEGTADALDGRLDELRISSTVRSANEIFESYARGLIFTALAVNPDPALVAEGWTVTPAIAATVQGGAVLAVPPVACSWSVVDTTIATVDAQGRILGRRAGTTVASATWHGVSDGIAITVQAALPAPANPHAVSFCTTARVSWDAVPGNTLAGYEVERCPAGGAFAPVKRVLARTDFTDSGLTPGQTYEYRVVAIDAAGSRLSAMSATCAAALQADLTGLSRHKNLEALIVIYTDGYAANDLTRLIGGAKKAMEFSWRTTEARLNFDATWLLIDAPLPAAEWGAAIESDLRARGVVDDQYDVAYLMGDGLAGCLSPYHVFNSTLAAMGTVCRVPYPEKLSAVDYSVAWTFTHEMHHALERMDEITGGTTPPVLFCHFPWDYPAPLGATGEHIDWAAHYNGIATTNRLYQDGWLAYPAPYDGVIECADADQDGLPDADDRVPMDESRFGSNPSRPDTDTDGLNDRAEFSRYDFRGTDPNLPDTDGDGRLDGADPQPLYAVPASVPPLATAPVIDGAIEPAWTRLATGYYYTSGATPFTLETYAGWRPDGLYLAFTSSERLRFHVSIDGSGADGRFESPVRYVTGATDTDNPDNKQNHIGDSWGDGNQINFAYGSTAMEVYERGSVTGAQVASTFSGGVYRTEAKIPAALPPGAAYTWYPAGEGTPTVEGLTLEPGHIIGLNVTVAPADGSDGYEFSGGWTSLFETHSYVDFTLGSSVTAVTGPDDVGLPSRTALAAVYPNPFNPRVTIRYDLAAPGRVRLTIVDVAGREVTCLVDADRPAGRHDAVWTGRDSRGRAVASGVYFTRFEAPGATETRKVMLVR